MKNSAKSVSRLLVGGLLFGTLVMGTSTHAAWAAMDTYEPNDYFSTAYPAALGSTYVSYISVDGDQDNYKLVADSTGLVTVQLTNPASNELYKPCILNAYGNNVAYDETDSGLTATLTFRAVQGYTYFVSVDGNGSFDAEQPYTLNIGNVQPVLDTFEANDDFDTAYPITIGASYQSYRSFWDDLDCYKFTPATSGGLTIDFTPSANSEEYDVDVFDSTWAWIGGNNSYGTGVSSNHFTLPVEAGQTYFVEVQGSNAYDATHPYTLKTSLSAQ